MDPARTAVTIRIVTAASICAVLAVIPVTLSGALAPFIRQEFGFSESRLGLAVSLFYVASTLTSTVGGSISERIGARRTLALAVVMSSVTLVGMGIATRTWWHLAAFLALAGVASAVAQPATNMALTRLVRPGRQGIAFGLKQASAPAATLLAGLSVPLLGVLIGWRWAFVLAALLSLAFALMMPARGELVARINPRRGDAHHASTMSLLLLSLAVSLAVAAAASLGVFFVESAVAQGWSPAVAGIWMAVGSLASIVARVVWGWLADRTGPRFGVVAALMFSGSAGLVLLGRSSGMVVLGIASVVSFAFGWGWPGVFQFAAVRQRENAPGQATGIVMIGMYLGGVYGPATFGVLVERGSYALAWNVAAAAMVAGGILLLVGRQFADRGARGAA